MIYYIKNKLGIGKMLKYYTKAKIAIRDRKKSENVIFPMFYKYPLLTSNYFNNMKLKEGFSIVNYPDLDKSQNVGLFVSLELKIIPENYISPVWKDIKYPLNYNNMLNAISEPWLN